jgi:tetratricopeptide (TPR) repeat protein
MRDMSQPVPHPFTPAIHFCTVPRLMTLPARAVSFVLVALALVMLSGCDELSARSHVQEGNKDYGEQRYEKAVEHFEAALRKSPNLEIAHHNLAIAYTRLFKPGLETPENKAIADKAATHFAYWLDRHPDDVKIRRLLTGLWIDSGDYPKAIEFWKKEHDKNPKARDVIQTVANIYLKSGDWRTALEWYQKDVDTAADAPGKVAAYTSIANVAFGRLFGKRGVVVGLERTEIAEIGLEATGKGLELDPKAVNLWRTSRQLWKDRGYASGTSWANAISDAEAQVFDQQARVLAAEAKKAQDAAAGAGGTPPPAAPGNGT